MKPSAYKHIAAWCRLVDQPSRRPFIQNAAAKTNAPIDAVYYDGTLGRWATITDCGVQTRMSIERILNHGVSK